MKRSVKMLFGLAGGLAIGILFSMEFGIMALSLCGCVGMTFGLIFGSNTKKIMNRKDIYAFHMYKTTQ